MIYYYVLDEHCAENHFENGKIKLQYNKNRIENERENRNIIKITVTCDVCGKKNNKMRKNVCPNDCLCINYGNIQKNIFRTLNSDIDAIDDTMLISPLRSSRSRYKGVI